MIIKSYIKFSISLISGLFVWNKKANEFYFPNFMKMPIKFPIPKPWAIFPKSGKKTLNVYV